MTRRLLDLGSSILAAERSTRWAPIGTASLAVEDPFRLDLPAMGDPAGAQIDAITMETLGGLYLIAQLEQTGMLQAAELLVESRYALDLRSIEAAELLERVAGEAREWFPPRDRDLLYARVFGVGSAALASEGAVVNGSFTGMLLDLCSAISAWDEAVRFGRPTATRHRTAVTQGAAHLRSNLAPRQHGNTLLAARRIAAQVRSAFELLGHPGVVALVAGRGLWDVVRAVWTDEQPDIDRLVTTGQAGQVLIGWAGSSQAVQGEPSSSSVDAAVLWLMSAGFDVEEAA